MDPLKPAFDPVTLATPFFILTVVLEIVLARFRVVKANYEAKDTAPRNAEAHITHCGHRARRTGKLHAQVSYFEEHSFMLAVVLEGGH